VAHDRNLLVVMPDEVRKFDVEQIHQSIPELLGERNGLQKLAGLAEIRDSGQRILTPIGKARNSNKGAASSCLSDSNAPEVEVTIGGPFG